MTRAVILIPARLQASRLPGKPMADIAGEPMIVHVWRRAVEAELGRVIVATDCDEIASAIRAFGGEAVMTRSDHVSGSDRIFEAISKADPDGDFDYVINLQGDLPTLEPRLVAECLAPLRRQGAEIATIAAEIHDEAERNSPDVVKVVGTPLAADRHGEKTQKLLRALYFTRARAPHGDGPLYHHIGIYAYRRNALERFVSLAPSYLEKCERLEQLRALENGMRIDVAIVDTIPLGVDTPADLERARQILGPSGAAG